MALTDRPGVIIALAAVLVIIYLMWSLSRKASPQAVAVAQAPAQGGHGDDLLLRFITDEQGERLGETVAIDGDRVILKVKDGFVSVPASKVKTEGGNLQLDFGVDWDEAKRLGEAWRERSHKVITYAESEIPKDES